MYLTKYNSRGLTDSFTNSIGDLLDNFWGSYHTDLEVDEKEGFYNFSVELPGFDKSEIKVSSKNDELTVTAVSGEKKRSRSISLPSDCEVGSISAKLKNGVLNIKVPKAKEKSCKITIT